MQALALADGWVTHVHRCPSPHFNRRPDAEVSLLVIHNISLPAGQFGLPYIEQLFQGVLDINADASFAQLKGLTVSAHFLIRRDGFLIQFVNCNDRAWHAGVSQYKGQQNCNDFAIGIELEGCDNIPYTAAQYHRLTQLTLALFDAYPKLDANTVVGHCDIAPGRKTDPGASFDWLKYRCSLK